MAKYTITIKTLIDNNFDFQMTQYPIFDEEYRNTLNTKILNHYYENEIGFETAPLFRFYLNQKLNEIMPYYNNLYKAQKQIIDENLLLNNVNLKETFEHTNKTTTTSESSSNSQSNGSNDSKNLFLDTPQGNTYKGTMEDTDYATNVTFDKSASQNNVNDTSNVSGTANNTESYIKTITGNNGGKFNIDLLNDIKDKIMNIDMMVINDLNELFMQIF